MLLQLAAIVAAVLLARDLAPHRLRRWRATQPRGAAVARRARRA